MKHVNHEETEFGECLQAFSPEDLVFPSAVHTRIWGPEGRKWQKDVTP
jgi:hypothetical protein